MKQVDERPMLPHAFPQNQNGLMAAYSALVKSMLGIFSAYGFRLNRTMPLDGSEAAAALPLASRSTDPADPADGGAVIWLSDGTGAGDDGDLMVKITDTNGTTKTGTLADFSAI